MQGDTLTVLTQTPPLSCRIGKGGPHGNWKNAPFIGSQCARRTARNHENQQRLGDALS